MSFRLLPKSMGLHALVSSISPALRSSFSHSALVAIFLAAAAISAQAANGTWNATTGTQAWSLPANWQGGTIPGSLTGLTNADIATFGTNTANTLITIDAGRNIRSLVFNGTNNAGTYTIGSAGANQGPALNLSSGGSITVNAGTLTPTTIHAPLVLQPASATTAGTYTIANNATPGGSGDLNPYKIFIEGNISGGTTTASITLTLGGSAGNRNDNTTGNIINGQISNGQAAGGLALTISTPNGDFGAWKLTNNTNNFTGNVNVTTGTLIVSSIGNQGEASAIGAGNMIIIGGGGHLKYEGGAATTNRTISAGGGSFYNHGSGPLTLTGDVILASTLTFRGGGNFIINGLISGVGGLNRTDGGTVFLNSINTFLGNTSISDGAFRVSSIADKNVNSPLGAGTIISLGQNSSTTGRLEFDGLSGGSTDRDIRLSNGNAANSGNGRISNLTAGQTLTIRGNVYNSDSIATYLSSLDLSGAGNGIISGTIGGTAANLTASTALLITKTGTGTWEFSNSNTYNRGTTISGGTLLITNTVGSGTGTGNVTTSSGATLGGTGFIRGSAGANITIASGTQLMIGNTHNIREGVTNTANGYESYMSTLTVGSQTNVGITLAGNLQFDLFYNFGVETQGSDRLILETTSSNITLGGTVAVADASGDSYLWREGSAWKLIDWTGIGSATKTGSLNFNFTNAPLASGYSWVTDTFLTDGVISIAKTGSNHTWTGGGGNGSWATAANWEIGTLPGPTTDVFFTAATPLATAIDGNKDVRNLFFSGEANYSIATGTGGVLYTHGSRFQVDGGTQTIGAQLRITGNSNAPYTIQNNSASANNTLAFNSPIMFHKLGGNLSTQILIFDGPGNTSVAHFQRRTNSSDMSIVKNGTGTLTITGFTAAEAGSEAGAIKGSMTINKGKVNIKDERSLGTNPLAPSPAHLTINGGTLQASATFTMDDENRGITIGENNGTIEVDSGFTLTIANDFAGEGFIEKTGNGTLIIASGNNTNTGGTYVTGGALQISQGAFSNGGGAAVVAGASINGAGTIQATEFTLLSGASLEGGDFISGNNTGHGTLTFTPLNNGIGTYSFETGSYLLLSLTSATNQASIDPTFGNNAVGSPGYNAYLAGISGSGNHDQLAFNGAAGSTLDISSNIHVFGVGFVPSGGQVFKLLDWSSLVTVDFSNFVVGSNRDGSNDDSGQFNLPDISSYGYYWDVSLFTTHGIIVVVPEPSRIFLLTLGLMFVINRRRRK
jgi:autotransporter-associated beta strand protein